MSTERFPIGAVAPRRIYAQLTAHEFEQFRLRATAEGMRVGDALNAIAVAYASGDFYVLARDGSRRQSVNHYLQAHATRA